MSYSSSVLLYSSLIYCVLFTQACQTQKPPASSKSSLNTAQTQVEVHQKLTWPQAINQLNIELQTTATDVPNPIVKQINLLRRFADQWPTVAPLLELKISGLLTSTGQWSRGLKLAQTLWDSDEEMERESRYFIAANATQCTLIETALNSSILDQKSERYLSNELRLHTHCEGKTQRSQVERKLALINPHLFTNERVIELFKKVSAKRALDIAKILEKRRAPKPARDLLDFVLKREELSPDLAWELAFEKERIQVERVREDFIQSTRRIVGLARAKKSDGRKASLLLGKAWSKANRSKKAARVYINLIKEWRHSLEARTARFRLAFIHYEQKRYRLALKGFAELSRHKGEVKQLKRFPNRAPSGEMTNNAEWYYAWCLYLLSPKQAAPFLEILIGDGLPLSAEGRRAAYWASKAYSSHNPQKADELRHQLLKGAWGDWYSLLLRAQDPSLAADFKPWPLMPPLAQVTYHSPSPKELKQHQSKPSLDPTPALNPPLNSAEIEKLSMRRQVAIVLKQSHLIKSIDKRLPNLIRDRLNREVTFSAWATELEQYKTLHSWSISQSISRLREVPSVDEHEWWRSVYPLAYETLTHQASQKTGITQEILLSFIYKESAFAPRAVSHAYAMGLMQLLEKTAKSLHPERSEPDLLDPQTNIQLGAEYLAALASRYHDQLPLMAAAYNAGPKNLNTWLIKADRKLDLFVERIPFREAREYVKKLTAIYCTYQFIYGQQSLNHCASQLPLTLNISVNPGVEF
jgi:soluble lytic murein transglycosylase-like protein